MVDVPPSSGLFGLADTIVAQATAPGRGALAVIRLSGPNAHDVVRAATDRWPESARQLQLTQVRDAEGRSLDQALVVRYDKPASYTGEDAAELITHGGFVVPTTIIAALIARGARLAEPGEFTRRAVLNGKLDILQAEATGDLIDADSRAAQSAALRQLDGGLSRRILALRDDVIGLEALIAYSIDFPEEDDGPIPPERVLESTDRLIASLEQLVATGRAGELVREGALIVLAGAPNVGKSSLFNALVGRRRAIVTDIPGTTRDAIEAVIDTPAVPLRLVDTAGMRDASDPIERMGVEISTSYASRAAVLLACGDSAESFDALRAVVEGTDAPVIAVRTKADLPLRDAVTIDDVALRLGARTTVSVSAETGEGLSTLIDAIVDAVTSEVGGIALDAPLLTHERHRFAVGRALEEVREFRERWREDDLPPPIAAVHLRTAASALEDLIGNVDVEDVLDEVFRRFCVGK